VESLEECSPDEDEFLEVEKIPLQAAVEMCLNNEIPDSKTQILILKVATLVQQGKF
jgi:ADP-ribose pyrophosphatase